MTLASGTLHAPPKSQPWRWSEIQLLATVMLINIVDGLDNQLLPLSLGTLSREWGVHPAVFSGAVSAGFVGAALGTPIGGWLGDRWGRKPAIITGMLTLGLMTLTMAFCRTTGELVIARLGAGIGLGTCLPPMMALVIETVTPEKRGTAVALTMFSLPLGLTLSGVAVPRLNEAFSWEVSVIVCSSAVLAVAALASLTLREAPRDADAGGHRQAGESLGSRLRNSLRGLAMGTALALVGGMFLVYIAVAVVLSWLPVVSLGLGFSQVDAGQAISLWTLSGMAGTLATGWAVNRIGASGAAKLIVGGFGGSALISSAVLAAVPDDIRALYLSAGFVGFFASAAITALYSAAAEQFPSQVRAKGLAITTLAGKAGGVIGGASGVIVLALPSLAAFFGTLGAIVLAGWLCLLTEGRQKSDSGPAEASV